MIWRFIRKLLRNGSDGTCAIPFREARLCVNCETVIREPVCPICSSKHNLVLGKTLGMVIQK